MKILMKWEGKLVSCLAKSKTLPKFGGYKMLKKLIQEEEYAGLGNKMGEGWLLIAEVLELIHLGVNNVICAQPFGCLPNHIIGKGIIKTIKKFHPEANIVPIDFDPGASRVNQINRIKLMLANAKTSSKLDPLEDSTLDLEF
jgi:predicted nucleotide-binding protein (sugar kinase/HSP70/actin superfamily)